MSVFSNVWYGLNNFITSARAVCKVGLHLLFNFISLLFNFICWCSNIFKNISHFFWIPKACKSSLAYLESSQICSSFLRMYIRILYMFSDVSYVRTWVLILLLQYKRVLCMCKFVRRFWNNIKNNFRQWRNTKYIMRTLVAESCAIQVHAVARSSIAHAKYFASVQTFECCLAEWSMNVCLYALCKGAV